MNFTFDIYISYALKDNHQTDSQAGWVSNFQRFLETLIFQIMGEKPSFLNYESQEKPAKSELVKVAVFVCIVSPEYVKSESSIEEIDDFFNIANTNGNLFVNGKERVLKVVKFPVPMLEQPTKVANLLEYDLYQTDSITGQPNEFVDFFNIEAQRKYWLKIVDLAYDISAILKSNRKRSVAQQDYSIYNEKNVYLAESGFDLQLHRDSIKRELTRHGFRVLPDHALPTNLLELELAIKKDIERSRLSIHLVGDSYGEYAPTSPKSILEIQNKLAGDHSIISSGSANSRFSRLIWISPDAKLDNDKQKMFIDNLRRDLEANEGAEILQSPIEDFKMVVLGELLDLNIEKLKRETILSGQINQDKKNIYLIFDNVDRIEAQKIADFLNYKGYQTILPSFEGELLELREIHLNNLKQCDAALIYIDKVNDLWVQMKFLDLLKAPGLGRTKQELFKALVLGKDVKNRAGDLNKFDAPVFEINDNIENSLAGFIKEFAL
ncbi:MAG: hypothetical protein ACKVOU_12870 [Cytophagales bacterium]